MHSGTALAFSWGRFFLQLLAVWVLIVLLAARYEALTGTGKLLNHPEAVGAIVGAIAIPFGVISYLVQTRVRSWPIVIVVYVVYGVAVTWIFEGRRSRAVGAMHAEFVKKCRSECRDQAERCESRCECIWREIRKAYPDKEDLDLLEKTAGAEELRAKVQVFIAACATGDQP